MCIIVISHKMVRLNDQDRAIALGELQAGRSQRQVARSFGISQSTVSALVDRFQATGHVKDRPRSGRPRATSAATDGYIRRSALRQRDISTLEIQNAIARQGNRPVTAQLVRNRLRSSGIRSRKPARKPMLTDLHKQRRLQWARRHLRRTRRQWGSTLFTDESRFGLHKADGRRRVWRRRGERFAPCCIQRVQAFYGGGIMVWGGISRFTKTRLVIIRGNINSVRYINEILTPVVLPHLTQMGRNVTYQDDNARPHRANIVNAFHQRNNINHLEWPANSPDMSPIEHCWDVLERRVRPRLRPASTLADLERFLREEWDAIPQATITTLIDSMRRRCQACIDSRGDSTRY